MNDGKHALFLFMLSS